MEPTYEQQKMAIEMVADDDAFFTTYQGDNPDGSTGKYDGENPKFCLSMNDVWLWGCADCETIEWADVPSIYLACTSLRMSGPRPTA